MISVSKLHGFEVRILAHHYAPTSCLAHGQCATIRMNTVWCIWLMGRIFISFLYWLRHLAWCQEPLDDDYDSIMSFIVFHIALISRWLGAQTFSSVILAAVWPTSPWYQLSKQLVAGWWWGQCWPTLQTIHFTLHRFSGKNTPAGTKYVFVLNRFMLSTGYA